MAESRSELVGRWRMHKRTETKPDGRKLYYYSFEPAEPPLPQTPLLEKERNGEAQGTEGKLP